MQPWELVESESVHDFGIFKARVDRMRSPRNQHVLRRVILDPPDWVNVVARTVEGQFLIVRQVRHGTGESTWEIPAGAIDAGESPQEAAERELLEETGYRASSFRELGRVLPNPAFQSNTCYLFLAEGCEAVAQPQLDASEDIQLQLWDWDELLAASRDGRIQHSLVIAALYYLRDQEPTCR
jgi:ADP-ribose pyrophosphatase